MKKSKLLIPLCGAAVLVLMAVVIVGVNTKENDPSLSVSAEDQGEVRSEALMSGDGEIQTASQGKEVPQKTESPQIEKTESEENSTKVQTGSFNDQGSDKAETNTDQDTSVSPENTSVPPAVVSSEGFSSSGGNHEIELPAYDIIEEEEETEETQKTESGQDEEKTSEKVSESEAEQSSESGEEESETGESESKESGSETGETSQSETENTTEAPTEPPTDPRVLQEKIDLPEIPFF